MFSRKKKKNVFSNLRITNKVIAHGGQAWQLQNITRVGKYEIEKDNPYGIKKILQTLALFGGGLFLLSNDVELGVWVIVLSGGYLAFQLYKNSLNKPEYGLRIETSSGSAELFTSPDEEFIDRLVTEITEVIHTEERKELTVNIDSRTIYDNIHNSTIVSDSEVNNSFNNRFKIID